MIEVEIKFQPSKDSLEKLLSDSVFLKNEILKDCYYDYNDFQLFKNNIRLRNRNGVFELKIKKGGGISEEIDKISEIEKFFQTDNLNTFVKNNLIPIINYQNKRSEYQNGEFYIDVDNMDFGYDLCEIELRIENEKDANEAREKILKFSEKYGFKFEKLESKAKLYFKKVKPEIYKELIK